VSEDEMSKPDSENHEKRVPLSRERVLRGAIAVADAAGIEALTIRSLARELGVKPMAIYYHVPNKSAILDGIVDLVFAEIELPANDGDWRSELVRRANSARRVLSRHHWAIGLMESRRSPGPATLRHHDAVIGTLRRAGFSVEMTAHAYALLDSYVYGFALQEAAMPFQGADTAADVTEPIMQRFRTISILTSLRWRRSTSCSPAMTSATSSSSDSASSSTPLPDGYSETPPGSNQLLQEKAFCSRRLIGSTI